MKQSLKYRILFIAIFAAALFARTMLLQLRPMHTDEAVHGLKFADLLENGRYIYDKVDYHGPTLNYFTLLSAWLKGEKTIKDTDETTLRLVPAIFGTVLLILLLFLTGTLGWVDVLLIAVFIAFSPALVFYSRYYIHDSLLLFFNLGLIVSVFRYFEKRTNGWAIAAGIFAGLMFSTKETWILLIGAQVCSMLILLLIFNGIRASLVQISGIFKSRHFYLFLLISIIIYLLFYSSFFSNPSGIRDSILSYRIGFNKASGQSQHNHPWWYYFDILAGKSCLKIFRADLWFIAGGIMGMIALIKNRSKADIAYKFYLFAGISAVMTFVTFSVLSYKTPWNIISIIPSLAILTSYSISSFLRSGTRIISYFITVLIVFHLGIQVYSDNFVSCTDQCNSFVYSHPTDDVLLISDEIHNIEKIFRGDSTFYIDIIIPHSGYWPLPWYLRDLSKIAWRDKIDFTVPSAPLILTTSENPDLLVSLFEKPSPGKRYMYIPVFERNIELRPGTEVSMYLRKDYYEIFKPDRNSL